MTVTEHRPAARRVHSMLRWAGIVVGMLFLVLLAALAVLDTNADVPRGGAAWRFKTLLPIAFPGTYSPAGYWLVGAAGSARACEIGEESQSGRQCATEIWLSNWRLFALTACVSRAPWCATKRFA